MRYTCYLDLDGLLCDFVRGALAFHGKDVPVQDIRWGIEAQLGFTDAALFWRDLGFDYWANLPWTKEGKTLLAEVERIFGDAVVLMTSPCDTPGGVEGKVAWIRRELPSYARRFFVGPPKHLAAASNKVLLDDHDTNVERFRAAGGRALLVPRPWNERRQECSSAGDFCVNSLVTEIKRLVGDS